MSRWVEVEKPTFRFAFGLVLVMWIVSLPFAAGTIWLANDLRGSEAVLFRAGALGLFIVQVVLTWCVIGWIVPTTFAKAIGIWVGALVAGAISVALAFFVMKPFVLEGFVVPTNNMAPTIQGWHEVGTCPHCAGTLMIPVRPPDEDAPRYSRDQIGICESCGKTSVEFAPPTRHRLLSPDRIMSNKLLTPQRWDMIVYRTPRDPKVKVLMRLVGLPGETVVLKEGAVWIDGVEQTPPAEIALLEYLPAERFSSPTEFATEENPLKLSASECCVLGDFPARSADSRYYGPVPWENIEGVLGLRYWPPARWKLWK